MNDFINATSNPALYILMRNDLASLTTGRAMAQASHAANSFEDELRGVMDVLNQNHAKGDLNYGVERTMVTLYKRWKGLSVFDSSRVGRKNFGTAIVLSADLREIERAKCVCESETEQYHIYHDTIIDPRYAIKDGDSVHKVPVLTCLWLFGDRNDPNLQNLTQHLPIYP